MRYLIAILLAVVFITASVAVANDNDAPRGFLRATIESGVSGTFTGNLTLENGEEISNSTDGLVCIEGNGGTFDQDICIDLDGSGVIVISAPAGATSINWGSLDHTMGDLTVSGPINEASSTSIDLGVVDGCIRVQKSDDSFNGRLCLTADGVWALQDGDGTDGTLKVNAIDMAGGIITLDVGESIKSSGDASLIIGDKGVIARIRTDSNSGNLAHLVVGTASTSQELTASSLEQFGLRVLTSIRQTGSAHAIGISYESLEQSLGSGGHTLLRLLVGASNKFNVDNSGNTTIAGDLTVAGTISGAGQEAAMGVTLGAEETIDITDVDHVVTTYVTGATTDVGITFTGNDTGPCSNMTTASGGAAVNCADTGHGMITGAVVNFTNVTPETTYNGIWAITRIDDDNFTIPVAFTSNDTGDWKRGDRFVVDAGGAGNYEVLWHATTSIASGNNKVMLARLYVNEVAQDANFCIVERNHSTTDLGSIGFECTISLAVADEVFVTIQNTVDSVNMTLKHSGFNMHRE